MASWMPKASSNRNRACPNSAWRSSTGSWTALSASAKGRTPACSTTQAGSVSPVSDGSTSCTDSAMTQVGNFDVAGYRPIMVARWTLRAIAACFVEDFRPDTLVPSSITKSGWASWSSPLKLPTRPMKMPLDPGCSRPAHHLRWRSYRANRVMDSRP